MKATIVTQQDQGSSGHRRVNLTTKVVARRGATLGCSGGFGFGPHTEACRVRLQKALADERASAAPVGAGAGPIAEPATESQEPAPAAQQEPASSSSGLAAPMPTQNLQNEQMDSTMELGAQERRERKGARPSETPASEISGRPVAKARPASPPMIVPMAEGSGTVVFSDPVSSSMDEIMIGGFLCDRWNQRCGNSCLRGGCVAVRGNRERAQQRRRLQDREQESIAVVNHEDPSTSEAFRGLRRVEQVKGSIQKRCGRDEPKRCGSLMNSKSIWRSTNQRRE